MNLHPDVISDLITLHQLGEASEATKQLLEQEAPQALKRAGLNAPALTAAPPNAQLESVRRLRRHMRMRSIFIGLGIFFALLPFSMRGSGDTVRFVVWEYSPNVAIASLILAAGWWTAGYVLNRRVNAGL